MGQLTIDYLRDSGSAVMGDPDACIAAAKRYEAVGCDLLLCLVNPLQDPAREGHAVHRAHGQARAARVQVSRWAGSTGKVALITGAASGLGLATVERFAKEGAIVVGADVTEADASPEWRRARSTCATRPRSPRWSTPSSPSTAASTSW